MFVVEGNSARQVLPANGNTEFATSRVIYLNHQTVTLSPGANDARAQKSSLVARPTTFAGWTPAADMWADTVACVQEIWAPFAVTVTDADPGNVPHIEAVFAGTPDQAGMQANVAGVSPFTSDCGIIDNSIVFTFAPAIKNITAREACEIMSQEIAHSYGLDHELLASDPMTYLGYNGDRAFQDQTVSCGEYTARPCGLSGTVCRPNQNSVELLYQRVGKAGEDTNGPMITFATPTDGEDVQPGFEVQATANDPSSVKSATISIDGQQVAMLAGAGPYTFTTDDSLSPGMHTVTVAATDGENVSTEMHTVTVQSGSDLDELMHGCSVGGGRGGWIIGLAAFLLARRRR